MGMSSDVDHFMELERAVWQALKDGDAAADARLLSEEFVGVYASGIANKNDHVGQLQRGPSVAWYDLSRAQMMTLAEGVVALTYLARWARAPISETAEAKSMVVTSIWRLEHGTWLNVFSQDTESRG